VPNATHGRSFFLYFAAHARPHWHILHCLSFRRGWGFRGGASQAEGRAGGPACPSCLTRRWRRQRYAAGLACPSAATARLAWGLAAFLAPAGTRKLRVPFGWSLCDRSFDSLLLNFTTHRSWPFSVCRPCAHAAHRMATPFYGADLQAAWSSRRSKDANRRVAG
jgi:hypothetical protein